MLRSNARLVVYALIAVLITAGSLFYSNHLARELLVQEEERMDLLAHALEFAGDLELDADNYELEWITKNVITKNDMIPTILVFNGQISSTMNLGIAEDMPDEARQRQELRYLEKLKARNSPEPLVIPYFGQQMHIYYDESDLLKKLRLYPYLMLVVIVLFISIVFGSFFFAKKNEQNKVWVGMAKETAHQLGTPVSSLMAWVELLELQGDDDPDQVELVSELKKDVSRLRTITERFSKIGSVPELEEIPLTSQLDRAANYLRKRMPKKVILEVINELPENSMVQVNQALFDWVIENLLKNALDAIKDQGTITIHAFVRGRTYIIDVEDTGKGIPKHLFKTVFKPGFTTKKRGWGLGLSLTKRVVENYHQGKITVHQSEVGKGTTFRVVLPR
jgi:anti-sigma regulatory factor (Ser/Thr protein kinase)